MSMIESILSCTNPVEAARTVLNKPNAVHSLHQVPRRGVSLAANFGDFSINWGQMEAA